MVTVVLCWTLVTDVGAIVLWMMVLGAEWKVCEVMLSGMRVKGDLGIVSYGGREPQKKIRT